MFKHRFSLFDAQCHEVEMVVADSEVYIDRAVGACSVLCALSQVFFESSTTCADAFVELKKRLRQLAIVETIFEDKCTHHLLMAIFSKESVDALAVKLYTLLVEQWEEGKLLNVVAKLSDECIVGCSRSTIGKREEVLKHAACCATCWHHLHHLAALCEILVPNADIALAVVIADAQNAIPDSSCGLDFQIRETLLKHSQFLFKLLGCDTFALQSSLIDRL